MAKNWVRLKLDWLKDEHLTTTAAVTLAVIVDRIKGLGDKTTPPHVVIKQKTLSEQCGLDRATTIRALDCLEKAGYIERSSTGKATLIMLSDNDILPPKRKTNDTRIKEQKEREKEYKDFLKNKLNDQLEL